MRPYQFLMLIGIAAVASSFGCGDEANYTAAGTDANFGFCDDPTQPGCAVPDPGPGEPTPIPFPPPEPDPVPPPVTDPEPPPPSDPGAGQKGIQDAVNRPLPAGDPNLNADWDWQQDLWDIYIDDAQSPEQTTSPFFEDAVFGTAVDTDRDHSPADGWMLVARDFGVPGFSPRIPWLLIYNKHRGLMRLCTYRTSTGDATHQRVTLTVDASGTDAEKNELERLFALSQVVDQKALAKTGAGNWFVAEFNVAGYLPSLSDSKFQQARFRFSMQDMSVSSVSISGVASTEGEIQAEISNGTTAGTLGKAISVVAKGASNLLGMSAASEEEAQSENAVGAGAARLDPVSAVIGAVGVVGGLVDTIFGSKKSNVPYKVSLSTQLTLKGEITEARLESQLLVFIRDDANNVVVGEDCDDCVAYTALQPIPWGVARFKSKGYEIQSTRRDMCIGWAPCTLVAEYSPAPSSARDLITINPAIADDVEIITAGFIFPEQSEVSFAAPEALTFPPTIDANSLPVAIGAKVEFKDLNPDDDVDDGGNFIYFRIPVTVKPIANAFAEYRPASPGDNEGDVTVAWDPVPGATRYHIYVPDDGYTGIYRTVETNRYFRPNLKESKLGSYRIRITAEFPDGTQTAQVEPTYSWRPYE